MRRCCTISTAAATGDRDRFPWSVTAISTPASGGKKCKFGRIDSGFWEAIFDGRPRRQESSTRPNRSLRAPDACRSPEKNPQYLQNLKRAELFRGRREAVCAFSFPASQNYTCHKDGATVASIPARRRQRTKGIMIPCLGTFFPVLDRTLVVGAVLGAT